MKFLLPYRKGTSSEKYVFYFSDQIIDKKYYEETIKFTQIDIDKYSETELKKIFSEYDYILLRNYNSDQEFKEEVYEYLSKFHMREKKLNLKFDFSIKEGKKRTWIIRDIKKTYLSLLKKVGKTIEKDCYFSDVFNGGIRYKKISILDKYGIYQYPIIEDAVEFAFENKVKLLEESNIKLKTAIKYLNIEEDKKLIPKREKAIERYILKIEKLKIQLLHAEENLKAVKENNYVLKD